MQLDRNTNRGGRGKYALVNMRKVIPLLEDRDGTIAPESNPILAAIEVLVKEGVVTFGNETPGDQFFVMKYKDKFTHAALNAYADAVNQEAHYQQGMVRDLNAADELAKYASQIRAEAKEAKALGTRIPD